jgi:transcriptional regulator with XRE-family HTH domain
MLRLLVQLRDDAGLDQTSLAHRLDITQSEISKYERGERNLDVLRLREWLHALEVEFPTFVNTLDQETETARSGLGHVTVTKAPLHVSAPSVLCWTGRPTL